MLVLLFLELDVEDPLADGQSAQLFDLFDLLLAGLLVDHLQVFECPVVVARVFGSAEGNVLEFIQVLEFILKFSQQLRPLPLLLQLRLELDRLVELAAGLRLFAAWLKAYIVLARILEKEGIIEYASGMMIMN